MKRKFTDLELELKSSQEANDSLADQLLTARENKIKLDETISTIEKVRRREGGRTKLIIIIIHLYYYLVVG